MRSEPPSPLPNYSQPMRKPFLIIHSSMLDECAMATLEEHFEVRVNDGVGRGGMQMHWAETDAQTEELTRELPPGELGFCDGFRFVKTPMEQFAPRPMKLVHNARPYYQRGRW